MKFLKIGSVPEIGIDLGTANTLIIFEGKIVLNEPSIIAIDNRDNSIIAVGKEAMRMHGKTPDSIKTIRPLRDGVIADFYAAEKMIINFVKEIPAQNNFKFTKSFRMLICIPTSITEVEKRAVKDSAVHAGAVEVLTIFEPIAAAIGIGLDVLQPNGIMVIDIGGGTTEIAIIALAGIVSDQSIRIAGDVFTMDIQNYIRKQYNLLIGETTGENIKKAIGSALSELEEEPDDYDVVGRDLLTGIPKVIKVHYSEISFALDKSITKIEDAVIKALENAPPEISSDLYKSGIYLSGGGALIRGLGKRLENKTKLKVIVADNPLEVIIKGTGIAFANRKKFNSILMS
jgi:rod shape-determining protein MreB